MLQALAQAIPFYVISCFRMSKSFLHELNMIFAHFWWGDTKNRKRIHWKKWDALCCSKLDGGFGLKNLESFNLALLAKQWWRILRSQDSFCYKVLQARYFPGSTPTKALRGSNSSYMWKSLLAGKEVVDQGTIWRVGDGLSIDA